MEQASSRRGPENWRVNKMLVGKSLEETDNTAGCAYFCRVLAPRDGTREWRRASAPLR
jgi:hypothetical protein